MLLMSQIKCDTLAGAHVVRRSAPMLIDGEPVLTAIDQKPLCLEFAELF